MDYFDPFAGEVLDLDRVTTRMRAISFDSDWRFGSEHSRHIVQVLGEGGVEIDHVEINSPWGHDSFLLELPDYHGAVAEALAAEAGSNVQPAPQPQTSSDGSEDRLLNTVKSIKLLDIP